MQPVPLLTMREAVQRFVRPQGWIYVGNFGTLNFAFAHELIRQQCSALWVVMSGGGVLLDQLLGAGLVERAVVAHVWNPVGPSPTHNWRRVMEGDPGGRPHIVEMSLGSLNLALMAGAYGWPFAPELALAGTGYVGTLGPEWYAQIEDPFSRRMVGLVSAIRPSLGVFHAQQVDEYGNARIFGPRGEVALAAMACDEVIVIAEERVSHDLVRERPWETVISGHAVAAAVIEPWAAHPEGVYGYYERDLGHFLYYAETSKTEAGFKSYLERFVTGVPDRQAYLTALQREGLWPTRRLGLRPGWDAP